MSRRSAMAPALTKSAIALAVTAGIFVKFLSGGTAGWNDLPGFLPMVLIVALAGLASDRIRRASLTGVIRASTWWTEYMTRVPFWYMAGGMGAVLGILIARKFALLEVREIPIASVFTRGANIDAAFETAMWLLGEGVLKRDAP